MKNREKYFVCKVPDREKGGWREEYTALSLEELSVIIPMSIYGIAGPVVIKDFGSKKEAEQWIKDNPQE